jgi:hypothetical protein
MPSDYEQICTDNIRRRGEEFDDIGRLISEQLYSDRTHFIYELLQNAEDALGRRKRNDPESKLPTSVKFILYKDRLEFKHFGENFNTNDVKAISDVLKGTKSEDKTQIGKFGIGFKSVYAFTSTPEIHSGDENFVIERYIRPRSANRITQIVNGETIFIFPFNHKDLSEEQAFQLIEDKLKKIGSRVLLFLRYITEIEWIIEDQDEGLYLKDYKQQGQFAQKITVIGQHGNEDEEEEWVVFKRQIEVVNSSVEEGFVEVALRLIEDKNRSRLIIRRIESSPLVVYFPTKLETRFGFLVHGPYDTTASRSDIEDNDWNRRLILQTASLLTETVLPWFKQNRLLTSSFLDALPIRIESFPRDSLFRPIYEKVRTALRDQEFLPTADGNYVAGKRALLARAEDLVNLMTSEQLSFLLNKSIKLEWLTTDITETKKDLYRYLVGWKPSYYDTGEEIEPLIVAEIRPQDLVEKLTSDFLEEQSVTWLLNLYAFFEKRPALIEKLKSKPIVRLEEGLHVIPFKQDGSPNAYLPPENDTKFPVVPREISNNEIALEFLKKLGLTKPDVVSEVIEHVLPKYRQLYPDISDDEHHHDIKKILKAYQIDSQKKKKSLVEQLQATNFVCSVTPSIETTSFRRPTDTYFLSNELGAYFSECKTVGFVRPDFYDQSVLVFLKDLGVTDKIRIRCKSKNGSLDYVPLEYKNGYRRGLRGFDPDIQIDGIKYAIRTPSIEICKIIWNEIAVKYSHCIKGKILRSSRQDFSPNASVYEEEEFTSKFGRLLIESVWLPDKQGNFHKPSELKLDDMPESFVRDEKLGKQLGMKKDIVAKLAEEAGISQDAINIAKELECHPELLEEFRKRIRPVAMDKQSAETKTDRICYKDELEKSFNRPGKANLQGQDIDAGKVKDPARRREKSYEEHKKRLDNEPTPNERRNETTRTILEGPNEQVREYLSQFYDGNCQICGKTFPERDGKPFFIANYIVSKKKARFIDTPANALCLCADHFAKWQHGAVETEDIIEQIENFKTESEGDNCRPVLKISLCSEECEIKFIEKHLLDLQELLRASESGIDYQEFDGI